ncbi:MAG: DUF5615 family PIN-like protein [Nanoarchaeota archaeon]
MYQKSLSDLKFLLDENIPNSTGVMLILLGSQVEFVKNIMLGALDKNIIKYAKENKFILISKDLDFGNLLLYPKGSHYGLIIVRTPYHYDAQQITSTIKEFILKINPLELINSIIILELGKYRIRKF